MTKTYINNAVVGNSRMLACMTEKGELVRLFWPNIDYPQHIENMAAGVFFDGIRHSTRWLHYDYFQHRQSYVKDTNILETSCTDYEKRIKVIQRDYALSGQDVLVRQYEVENFGDQETELGFVFYSACITTTPELRSTLFDFGTDALIHYKHNYYIAISANREVYQFQLGNNAFDGAQHTELKGYESIGMMPDGAVSWKLGKFAPGEKKTLVVSIAASNSLKSVKKLVQFVKNSDIIHDQESIAKYWHAYLAGAKKITTSRAEVEALYNRSLLVFKLMADERSGGLLAAPEIDENFTRCGRYAYCWGRDAAFITGALDQCGLTGAVDQFYDWAVEVQDEDGAWQQRYHMDGNLAPSWGLQIDETGTLIWGMLKHYKVTRNKNFLQRMWNSVEKGVDFLVRFIDPETGLPSPSYDLWEERVGEHTYSSAAVCGGIHAGVEIARELGIGGDKIQGWSRAWEMMKEAMVRNLWKEDRKCFLRSVRTKLNPWGSEHSDRTAIIRVNDKGYYRDVTLEDGMIDVSLLGVSVPFGVFDIEDEKVVHTVETIESVLTSPGVGGIKRYESDHYIGGNPWILTTLWVALYYAKRKQYQKARNYFDWAVKSRTELDLLPEQVHRDTGKPEWVIPLTWSHAMFVLVAWELSEAGEL